MLDACQRQSDVLLQEGILSTGNSFDATEKDLEWIKKNDATVKDMEVGSDTRSYLILLAPSLSLMDQAHLVAIGRSVSLRRPVSSAYKVCRYSRLDRRKSSYVSESSRAFRRRLLLCCPVSSRATLTWALATNEVVIASHRTAASACLSSLVLVNSHVRPLTARLF